MMKSISDCDESYKQHFRRQHRIEYKAPGKKPDQVSDAWKFLLCACEHQNRRQSRCHENPRCHKSSSCESIKMNIEVEFRCIQEDKEKAGNPKKHQQQFHGLVRSNETAAFIVNCLKKETTEEAIVEAMLEQYDAPRETVARDVHRVVEQLRQIGALA